MHSYMCLQWCNADDVEKTLLDNYNRPQSQQPSYKKVTIGMCNEHQKIYLETIFSMIHTSKTIKVFRVHLIVLPYIESYHVKKEK